MFAYYEIKGVQIGDAKILKAPGIVKSKFWKQTIEQNLRVDIIKINDRNKISVLKRNNRTKYPQADRKGSEGSGAGKVNK